MSNEDEKKSSLAKVGEAKPTSVVGMAYRDIAHPPLGEVGSAVGRAVRVALSPVRGTLWCFEQVEAYVKVIPPNPHVAGPALEALRFTSGEPDLREMFASLLGTAMNADTAHNAHPSFVDAIKTMTSDEAKIVKHMQGLVDAAIIDITLTSVKRSERHMTLVRNCCLLSAEAGCAYPDLEASYVDNLCRLKLLEIRPGIIVTGGKYQQIFEEKKVSEEVRIRRDVALKQHAISETDVTLSSQNSVLTMTSYGQAFYWACCV
jgi:hypothetical protein